MVLVQHSATRWCLFSTVLRDGAIQHRQSSGVVQVFAAARQSPHADATLFSKPRFMGCDLSLDLKPTDVLPLLDIGEAPVDPASGGARVGRLPRMLLARRTRPLQRQLSFYQPGSRLTHSLEKLLLSIQQPAGAAVHIPSNPPAHGIDSPIHAAAMLCRPSAPRAAGRGHAPEPAACAAHA
eukprot:351773-Chlamydomonas_euryale.AAC.3